MDDTCTSCERESLVCSKAPCPDVIADRGELWEVEMKARTIQVTADDEGQASGYAREDAGEFMGTWNYEEPVVTALDEGEEPAEDASDVRIEVESTGVEAGIHTFDGTFRVVVEASDEVAAVAGARRIMGIAA